MFGLTIEKLFAIALIAAIIIGPQRLPLYAAKLAAFVRAARAFAETAKVRVAEELGPEFDTIEWKKLDPRQFDPRRIVQDALADDESPASVDASARQAEPALEPAGAPEPALEPTPEPTLATRGWQNTLLSRVSTEAASEASELGETAGVSRV